MRGRNIFKHVRAAYRSGLEVAVAAALSAAQVAFQYETIKIPFIQPQKARTYCPDILLSNGIVCELKGLFTAEDRQKHLWVKEAHPNIDIRLVLQNPNTKLYKGAKASYADWATKHGFKFAKKEIPLEWINEPSNERSLKALQTLGYKA